MQLYHGDCLEVMRKLPDKSVDMILCDLPYGITRCAWDNVIQFDALWDQYKRVIKDNGAILLFGSEPFSSRLRMSNPRMYRYDWIWRKSTASGHLNANRMPLNNHETISVFYKHLPTYHPQMGTGGQYRRFKKNPKSNLYGQERSYININNGTRYPVSVIDFSAPNNKDRLHPTQKPVELLEYLIKTYTDPGDVVLDNCMGSGSTGVACVRTGREFVGIEMDPGYFETARERIDKAQIDIEDSAKISPYP